MGYIEGVHLCGTLLSPGTCGLTEQVIDLCLNRLVWGGLRVTVVADGNIAAQKQALNRTDIQWSSPQQLQAAGPAGSQAAVVTSLTPPAVLAAFQSHSTVVWTCCCQGSGAAPVPAAASTSGGHEGDVPDLSFLPQRIAQWQAAHAQPPGSIHVVGYVMKASRERDMAQCTSRDCSTAAGKCQEPQDASKAGLLTLVPQQGLVFAPLHLGSPLDWQLPLHLVLHKASDELECGSDGLPAFSPRMQHLQQWLQSHPHICVIDDFSTTAAVINRLELCRRVKAVCKVAAEPVQLPHSYTLGSQPQQDSHLPCVFTAPSHCVLDSLAAGDVREAVLGAGIKAPYLVKPAVACGLHDSHRMLLAADLNSLEAAVQDCAAAQLSLPVIVQEFVNHGGKLAKVYVAGSEVYTTYRPSIPDIPALPQPSVNAAADAAPAHHQLGQQGFLFFDSLKTLPTSFSSPPAQPGSTPAPAHSGEPVDVEALLNLNPSLVKHLANALREAFSLTLFGFDVIVARHALDEDASAPPGTLSTQGVAGGLALHVIDVNYFPSYRMAGAATCIREALVAKLLEYSSK